MPAQSLRLHSLRARPITALALGLTFLLAACSSAAPSTPPVSDPPAPSSPSPTAPSPTAEPTQPVAPTQPPVVTPAPPTAAPTPIPMTPDELALVRALRVNAQVRCEARRTGLPDGAVAGVECRVNDGVVARVGAYRFADPEVELAHYLARLEQYGVEPNSGSCWDGTPGDTAWMPGDYEWPHYGLVDARDGCFLDENGIANVRVLCGGMYVGVLGTNDDLRALVRWTSEYDENYPGDVPAPPGICWGPHTPA
jgi:hypothetical protein